MFYGVTCYEARFSGKPQQMGQILQKTKREEVRASFCLVSFSKHARWDFLRKRYLKIATLGSFFLDYHFFGEHLAPLFLKISRNGFSQRIGKRKI